MKKVAVMVVLLMLSVGAFSQMTIKGRVITAASGAPVPGSSVFISNTSKGTTADKDGYFELTDIPAGKHELIISSIGYETNVFSFSSEQLPLQLRVELEVKVSELQNVTVEPFTEEGWDKWGRTFLDNFIGNTANAARCTIKNEKAIRFRYYKKSSRLVAFSDEPVVIENKALGYRIHFRLEDFEVNFKEHSSLFTGYPLFEEIGKSRKGLQNKWKRNRDKAYYGSMMHFMRSVYNNKIAEEGFEVRRMVQIPNTEKERVKKIYKPGRVVSENNSTNRIVTGREKDSVKTARDSADYYQRVLRQDDFIEEYGRDLLTADSLIASKDGNYKIMYFTDYLYVTFKKELEEEGYIAFFHENRRPTFQRSVITLIAQDPFEIDVNGSYYPAQELSARAYWGWSEKIADYLPLDYEPGDDQ
ncbi:MAG: carboxypeptidase-like regulatory domain-containing protein [Bacteroidota bacterium]|nr:carboxypeptidase-like regulatory domain-containing protein [Bacteroidota bacterium]